MKQGFLLQSPAAWEKRAARSAFNVHHDAGENGWLKANSTNLDQKKAMFTAIWEQISAEFVDYGDKLLFEGFNEILDESPNQGYNPSAEAVPISNDLNQIFVDTVRKSGGNNDQRVLVCNTYCAGANQEITAGFVLPNDTVQNKLIVETHIYQPFPFTSETYPDVTTWDSTSLDQYVDNIYNQFVTNGTPVIIGEFGCANKGNIFCTIAERAFRATTPVLYLSSFNLSIRLQNRSEGSSLEFSSSAYSWQSFSI